MKRTSIQSARARTFYACVAVALCLLTFGAPANADDGTTPAPRAVPLPRAMPRSFASYDALIAAAGRVATDQVTLYAQLAAARTEGDLAKSILASVTDPRLRGGLVHAEANVSDKPTLGALRAEITAAAATEARLVAGGATATPPTSTWQRPLIGEISQPFGPTHLGLEPARLYRGVYYSHFHDGVDIAAPGGTAIVAPARGRVVFVGRMGDGAEVIVLAHDDGLVSLYAHLENGPLTPTVQAGEVVAAGQRIGAVGLTGITTGFHLHWAVYKNDEPLDPLNTLGF